MRASAGQHPRVNAGIRLLANRVGADPCGIDDHPGWPAFTNAIGVFADGGAEAAVGILLKVHNRAAASQHRASLFSGQRQQQVETGVVELPIAVSDGSMAGLQLGQGLLQCTPGQQPTRSDALPAGQGVVDAKAKAVIGLPEETLCGQS